MYEIGTYLAYENKGICVVEGIKELSLPGATKGQKYYVLKPVYEETGTIYCAINSDKVVMRPMLSKEEADEILDEIPSIEQMWIPDEKQRELKYKEAMRSCDCRQWVSIIKTLYERRQNRLSMGKKTTNTDDRYYKKASENLYGELAMALSKEKNEIEEAISNILQKEMEHA